MIRFTDTYVEYRTGTRALRGVNMEINDGEFVFIVGPSGAGKSTLTKLLTAELRPSSGTVMVNGFSIGSMKRREIPALRRTVGVVYQDFKLIDRMSVFENVAFAMRIVGEHDREKINSRVREVLDLVGLKGKHMRRPGELSGGEQQRAVIARAIVNNPGMIIADEPTGNLDPARSFEIMELLVKINEMGSTVVVITHERELVDSFEKRVILIEDGRVAGDRESGYVDTMVSDGSEFEKPAESQPVAAEPEIAAEEPVSEPEMQEVPGEKVFVATSRDVEVCAIIEEEGTRFMSVSDEPEFLKVLIEGDGPDEDADTDADEDTLMAILGSGDDIDTDASTDDGEEGSEE